VKFYQKDYPEAERLLRLALEEDSTMLDGWVMLFNLALEQEEYQTAREALGSLREAMNNRLFSEFVQGQLDELSN
jgi:cytochrome c-type biogenesis protein CcmH/NrfG